MESQPQPQLPRPISHVFFRGCPKEALTGLLSRIPIHEGDMLSDELLQRTLQTLKTFDRQLALRVDRALPREAYLKLPYEVRNKYKLRLPASDAGVNITIYAPASLPQRIRVESSVQESMLIAKVTPVCSQQVAEDERDTGVVKLSVVVGKDGAVLSADPVVGPELLVPAAVDAAKQWRYRPTRLNGFPIEVQTDVEVNFRPKP